MKKIFLNIMFIFSILFSNLLNLSPILISANDNYTSVIEDLSNDKNFRESDYPIIDKKYTLEIIEIAESNNKELFIYVYNPSMMLNPESINLSSSDINNPSPNYKNYDIIGVSWVGTLEKYVVKDFEVSDLTTRTYRISTIFRSFYRSIDSSNSNGNTTNSVGHKVGITWTFKDNNDGTLSIDKESLNVIQITDKYVGMIRYLEGCFLKTEACDSHYVAFSTDFKIDDLQSAYLHYKYTTISRKGHAFDLLGNKSPSTDFWGKGIFKEPRASFSKEVERETSDGVKYINLSREEIVESSGSLFTRPYEYARIQSVEEFIDKENHVDEEVISKIENKDWVLRFAEYPYVYNEWFELDINTTKVDHESYKWKEERTLVSEVLILELTFKTNGVTYSLPTIDNKTTGSNNPDNSDWDEPSLNFCENLGIFCPTNECGFICKVKKIIKIIILIIAIIIAIKLIKLVVKLIKKVIEIIKNMKNKNNKK